MFHGGKFNTTTAYDMGLVQDTYGMNSFDEDIAKQMKKIADMSTQVKII